MLRSREALGSHGNTTQDPVENAVLHIVRLETGKKKGERFVILHTLLFAMTFQSSTLPSGYSAVGKRPLLELSDARFERNAQDQSNAIND